MYPLYFDISMPPTAPAMPPIPTTEPTATRGNMSDGSVIRLADQAWWAAVARPIMATAIHNWPTNCAKTIGVTASAQINMVVLRAAFAERPAFISLDEPHPPTTEPTSDSR